MAQSNNNLLHRKEQAIRNIAPNNEFIDYIIDRIYDDDYRGYQVSQHNRLTFDYFSKVLQAIYEKAGEKIFGIHVGDDKGEKQKGAQVYYEVVESVNDLAKKATINSLKKNTFVDLYRMGFIERYDKKQNPIQKSKRNNVYFVKLNKLAIDFLNASSKFRQLRMFSDAVIKISNGAINALMEIFDASDNLNSISLDEYTLIISDRRASIGLREKIKYLNEFRNLSNNEKNRCLAAIKNFCNPKNWGFDSKIEKRDYSNWKNESQQVFKLLEESSYFAVVNNSITLNRSAIGIYSSPKRAEKAKSDFFKEHKLQKIKDFELHHIIPFSVANNKNQSTIIDDFRNLVYLHKAKHLQFTISDRNNPFVRLAISGNNFVFGNIDFNKVITTIFDEDEKHNPCLIDTMMDYNKELIEKFYRN